ncbi:hypothetical protein PFLUV_G00092050 [Perca fluviatilis]|uniref:Uncharacterized protein n=1 Tax=Perca fluviatilis TaxID=8168 RepID=A0A6A5EH03_PERFL|nr:hypothetical protein PFLUV_G00092050 [Perca fluviatilis]
MKARLDVLRSTTGEVVATEAPNPGLADPDLLSIKISDVETPHKAAAQPSRGQIITEGTSRIGNRPDLCHVHPEANQQRGQKEHGAKFQKAVAKPSSPNAGLQEVEKNVHKLLVSDTETASSGRIDNDYRQTGTHPDQAQDVAGEPVLSNMEEPCQATSSHKGMAIDLLQLPTEILRNIFLLVVLHDGHPAIRSLALTCPGFWRIVRAESLRKEAHFLRLDSVVNWNAFSEVFKRQYRVPYRISCCIECFSLFKDCAWFLCI